MPTLKLATAKAAAPLVGTSITPLLVGVAANAMMSAIGVLEITRSIVSTPGTMAAAVPVQPKSSGMPGALNGVAPLNDRTKVARPSLPVIVTGVLGVPANALVAGVVAR